MKISGEMPTDGFPGIIYGKSDVVPCSGKTWALSTVKEITPADVNFLNKLTSCHEE